MVFLHLEFIYSDQQGSLGCVSERCYSTKLRPVKVTCADGLLCLYSLPGFCVTGIQPIAVA